jgi:methyltransferase (TIGR00027 family)
MPEPLISNVSDTARWVAAERAAESARPDALFDDPFADRLAGDRGRAMAATVPEVIRNGWPTVTRTKLIDDLVAESVNGGCERVLNLAAGLDTRPYRLELPAGLEWIEADLPDIITEKQCLLTGEAARCRLSRVAVDLADAPSRTAFLADATGDANDVLVITEGLLVYLSAQQVGALADDLHRTGIGGWITDFSSPAIVGRMMQEMPSLAEAAPLGFAPPDGVAFFERRGWSVGAIRSILKHAQRWKRLPPELRPLADRPEPDPRKLTNVPWAAVARFDR